MPIAVLETNEAGVPTKVKLPDGTIIDVQN